MTKGRNKGMKFERDTCKQLSLWWSSGDTDDVFWRSAASGGRATSRFKKGKSTSNAAGDICLTHPSGKRFLKLFTIELKKGYKEAHISNVLDLPERQKDSELTKFVAQAHVSSLQAGTPYWLLIHSRTNRPAMVYFPLVFASRYEKQFGVSLLESLRFSALIKAPSLRQYSRRVVCARLDEWLSRVKPENLRKMSR